MPRVLASDVTINHVTHLRTVLDSGLTDVLAQVSGDCNELAKPDVWDGQRASEFQAKWPELQAALNRVHADLSELALSIDQIASQILAAGGN